MGNHQESIDIVWMLRAIELAEQAKLLGEVSVGAVLIIDNCLIGEGWNSSINFNDPTAHAEILALRQGGNFIKNYRLLGATLYVTLEPCVMCVGAMIHARIKRLVFGAYSSKNGAVGSVIDLISYPNINHNIHCTKGILQHICSKQISNFFGNLRCYKK